TQWAPKGFVVSASQVRWQEMESLWKPLKAAGKSLKVVENDREYRVAGAGFETVFDKSTGALQQFVYQGQEVVKGAVLPNFVRPATENDRRGWKPDRKLKYWYGDAKLTETKMSEEADGVHVLSGYTLRGDSARILVRYVVKPQGIVSVNYD